MKTKPKIGLLNSTKKQITSPQIDSIRSSIIKEEINQEITSWDSRFESTALDQPICKYLSPSKPLKKSILDTSREQSARLKKSSTNQTLICSPRLMSPKEQVNVIHYLEQKNKTLLEENKRKENIISKLMNSQQPPKRVIKATQLPPPKTTEPHTQQTSSRFPQITTPQPQVNEFLVTNQFKSNQMIIQDQNYSFGKMPDEERNIKSPSQFSKINSSANTLQKTVLKNNFTKPLLKLPKEFHIQAWNSKKKMIINKFLICII